MKGFIEDVAIYGRFINTDISSIANIPWNSLSVKKSIATIESCHGKQEGSNLVYT